MRLPKLSTQSSALSTFIALAMLFLLSGCAIFGIAARAFPNMVNAAYPGLKGKTVAVMVWTDRAISVDWPAMSIDITAGLQKKLLAAQTEDKPKDLDGTTFPVTAQSMARFQMDHPEAQMSPITDIAPQVGVQRLIYIEINNFQTRSDMSVNTDLFRGQIAANVKVVEYENGKTKVVWQEDNVSAKFPQNAPNDGVTNIGDARTYVGTVDAFTTTLAQRFYKHEEPQD